MKTDCEDVDLHTSKKGLHWAAFLHKDPVRKVIALCSRLCTSQFTSAPSLSVEKALLGREAHFLREQSQRMIR